MRNLKLGEELKVNREGTRLLRKMHDDTATKRPFTVEFKEGRLDEFGVFEEGPGGRTSEFATEAEADAFIYGLSLGWDFALPE